MGLAILVGTLRWARRAAPARERLRRRDRYPRARRPRSGAPRRRDDQSHRRDRRRHL